MQNMFQNDKARHVRQELLCLEKNGETVQNVDFKENTLT